MAGCETSTTNRRTTGVTTEGHGLDAWRAKDADLTRQGTSYRRERFLFSQFPLDFGDPHGDTSAQGHKTSSNPNLIKLWFKFKGSLITPFYKRLF